MDILKVENLKKVYIKDKNEFTAVNNVDLNIKEGECVGLVGESGCGKSSIARILTKLEKHSGGNIFINDINNYVKEGIPTNKYIKGKPTKNIVFIGLAAGAIVASSVCFLVVNSYKNSKSVSKI